MTRREESYPTPMPIGKRDAKGYVPREGEYTIDEFYVVNHGKLANERWTLASLKELPQLVDTGRYGYRWQCKVMMYVRNARSSVAHKYLPEKRKGTNKGWETVNCQSLAFLTAKLPGQASMREMTQPHQKRLADILRDWDAAEESDEAEEDEEPQDDNGVEEDEEIHDPTYVLPKTREDASEEESD